MRGVPAQISATFLSLKEEFPFYIVLRKLNGRYYVYRQSTRFDKELKKVRSTAEYLGRIDESGTFIRKASMRMPAMQSYAAAPKVRPGTIDEEILTSLSMDAKANLAKLGRRHEMRPAQVYRRAAALERRYGIRYTAEIDAEKLGYLSYLALVKFVEGKPTIQQIVEAFKGEPRVQLCMMTTGAYDMLIYFLAKDPKDFAFYTPDLRKKGEMIKYPAEWYITPLYGDYGYLPLRDQFFDLLREQVWVRSRDHPRPAHGQLLQREYSLLRELNSDGNVDFADIEKREGLSAGSIRYSYRKLTESGMLRRVTVTMRNIGVKFNSILLIDIPDSLQFSQTKQYQLLFGVRDSSRPVNRLSYIADIKTPDGILMLFPIFEDGDADRMMDEYTKKVRGVRPQMLTVTNVAVGELLYRKFDNKQTGQYKTLVEKYKITPEAVAVPQN